MENIFISEQYKTHFYVNLIEKTYGACINIKDLERNSKIIDEIKEKTKKQYKPGEICGVLNRVKNKRKQV